MRSGPIISASGVTKTYRSRDVVVEALKNVSFEVTPGEMVAVMGPSGSGKTTLLNCMSGLDAIDSGDVSIAGQLLRTMSDDALSDYRASSMGFVFQAYNLLPVLSAQENVELPLVLAGHSQKVARARAAEKLDLVGLGDRTDHLPAELSGGQQQRVAIARALANDPAIVWADEPTGNLDSTNASEVMDLLVRLNKEHRQTFVLVTHSGAVGAVTDRIVRMSDGEIIDNGTARSGGAADSASGGASASPGAHGDSPGNPDESEN
ncbi:MAG: ABC transporter ATP-binding protein [Chloroflexi bacterium]|nr:ABC transporter ATP-binding protein [Chloroflexota bacterium]